MNKKRVVALLSVFLIILIPVQAISSLVQKSATFDEPLQLASGYLHLATGKFELDINHPPLAKQLMAIPLLFLELQIPTGHSVREGGIRFGSYFVFRNIEDADTLLFWGRIPAVLLTMLLAFIVFWWGRELYGPWGGLLALFLCALDPNILAHGRLATTDMAVTCFRFIAVYCFWKLLRSPTKLNLLLAGLTFGMAQAAKFSAVLLVPILVLLAGAYLVSGRLVHAWVPLPRWKWIARCNWLSRGYALSTTLLLIFIIGFAFIWVDYGLEIGPLWAEGRPFQDDVKPLLKGFPEDLQIPAPTYFYGLGIVRSFIAESRPTFLMGELSHEGWWYYFLVAFLIKTPVPLLLLLTGAAVLTVSKRTGFWEREAFLLLPVMVSFGATAPSGFNLGYRHILPVLPFLFVFAGKVATVQWSKRRALGIGLIAVLCVWQLVTAIRIYPHYLAYFNELAGGPENGYKYLVDSNLDWGQDLKGLGAYLKAQGIDQVELSYFGTADPAYYGINYTCLPSFGILSKDKCPIEPDFQNQAGVFAISATNLQGVYLNDPHTFDWLKEREPETMIGYSIFVYRVP